MPSTALLRAQIEAALADRIPSALSSAPRMLRQTVPTGISSIDGLLRGGFPAAALTEIVGPECSGRTCLALSFIAAMTLADKVCAWVDVSDVFDPESAAAAGVDLHRLLWVRCGSLSANDIQPSSHNTFALEEKYFIPKPIKQGLHGGGFGPHPHGEVKGLSNTISGLLRPEIVRPHDPEPRGKATTKKTVKECGNSQPSKLSKKPLPAKPWSRLDQALRVTDLLLQNGGFGAIVLDMGGITPEQALRVPLATWFRYRAAAEQKQTSVLLLMQHACAKSSAALSLRLQPARSPQEETPVFAGVEHCVEVVRERFSQNSADVIPFRKPPQKQKLARWQSRTLWTSR